MRSFYQKTLNGTGLIIAPKIPLFLSLAEFDRDLKGKKNKISTFQRIKLADSAFLILRLKGILSH